MTHYNMSYKSLDRAADDAKAISDIRDYLSPKQWRAMMDLVNQTDCKAQTVNFALSFAGVQGYPFHAFCRRYCLKSYREWMASEPGAIETDDAGFTIEEAK